MKKMLFTLLALILMLTLAACNSNSGQNGGQASGSPADSADSGATSGEKVKLKLAFKGTGGIYAEPDTFLADFYKANPDIEIEPIYIPADDWDQYLNKIQAMIAAGNSPDVVRVATEGVRLFVDQQLAVPLDSFIDKYPEIAEANADAEPRVQQSLIIDGKTYGYAFDWNNIVTHFNTTMLADADLPIPPMDWSKDDFLRYAQQLTTEKDGQKVFGFAVPTSYFAVSAWLFNNGASILNDNMTESTIDSPQAVEVIQFLQDLVYKYQVAPVPPPKQDNTQQITSGQVAMVSSGRWPFAAYQNNGFTTVDVQKLPKFSTQTDIIGTGSWVVLQKSKHQEEAFKLTGYMSSPGTQTLMLSNYSNQASVSVMASEMPKSIAKNWQAFSQVSDDARPVEAPKSYTELQGIFDRAMSQIYSSQTDVKSVLQKAKEEMDAALAK